MADYCPWCGRRQFINKVTDNKKKEEDSIFCDECKYFKEEMWLEHVEAYCTYPTNCDRKQKKVCKSKPPEINRNNDCRWFKEKRDDGQSCKKKTK